MPDVKALVAFHDEVQFCGWADNHTSGPRVTFWLADGDQLSFFRALTTKKGGRAGQRFYMTLVEIQDDERPVDQEKRRQIEEATRGGPLSKHAAMLCRDEAFRRWLAEMEQMDASDVTEEIAADWIRGQCGVESRAELDHNVGAAQKYHNLVREPFIEWLGESGRW